MVSRPSTALRAARLSAQGLTARPYAGPVEVTRHLLAVQGQDPRGARLAIRARTSKGNAADVDRALTDERSLVITWVNRGTLHLICSDDEPLLHALTTPQLRTSSDRRLRQEGVSPGDAARGITAVVKALGDGGPMTRAELRNVLDRTGVPTAGQAFIHVLFSATLDGLIVRGPMIDGEHAFVLAADWLGPRPAIDRDRALAELARRYLAGHGPSGEHDLAKWAQITLRDARAGLQAIAGEVVELPGGLIDLPREPIEELPQPMLLGAFDPLLLGWRSRDFVLPERHTTVVTVNGIFRPFALIDGIVAGTWAMPNGSVSLDLWHKPRSSTTAALAREAAAVEAYLTSPAA